MQLRTHLEIDTSLSGEVVELYEGYARLRLRTERRMMADETGLVHGGFIFSLADFCAMATINEPTVVLAQANISFLKPVVVGDELCGGKAEKV
ncbi:MAG: PaaI family thioesterase [Aquificaceae bacterium]